MDHLLRSAGDTTRKEKPMTKHKRWLAASAAALSTVFTAPVVAQMQSDAKPRALYLGIQVR